MSEHLDSLVTEFVNANSTDAQGLTVTLSLSVTEGGPRYCIGGVGEPNESIEGALTAYVSNRLVSVADSLETMAAQKQVEGQELQATAESTIAAATECVETAQRIRDLLSQEPS